MSEDEQDEFRERLVKFQQEHRDLDDAIEALSGQVGFDQLRVQRLKKRKLWLKDMIAMLEAELTPDIIA
ncbi:MAG: DUF465 domain-containing protein [Alphaproteobacteria bacterium]